MPGAGLVLYSPEPLQATAGHRARRGRSRRAWSAGRRRGTWWEQTHLAALAGGDALDVFFAPAYTSPLRIVVPLALTIHDISFVAHPEWFRWREGLRRRWLTRRSAHAADVVFTDSQFSRSEIGAPLDLEPSRIVVIPPGVTSRASARDGRSRTDGALRRVPVQPAAVAGLIAAFAQATTDLPHCAARHRRRRPFVAAARTCGGHRGGGRRSGAHRVSTRTSRFDELDDLYARSVFSFLSEYEGFGMTPLEALSAGVPSVVLDTAVARRSMEMRQSLWRPAMSPARPPPCASC